MNEQKKYIEPVAHIKNDFCEKFGIPRQSGIAPSAVSEIVFTEKYSDRNMLRGIEQFSHLWLIWGFSQCRDDEWSPTVRPPRLGGNTRTGVFATRSPFRPNHLGLSCVKLEEIADTESGTVLRVSGADILNGTPIYDIKPYIPYADCREDALGGFAEQHKNDRLEVSFSDEALHSLPPEKEEVLREVLSLDPRPAYQNDENRVYAMAFGGMQIKFTVSGSTLTVTEVIK